jgi:L-fucose isomerase-like protein
MSPRPVVGVMAVARATFDVAHAEETASRAFATLDRLDAEIAGPRSLLFDAEGARRALADLKRRRLDLMLVLQVTFTDAAMVKRIAEEIEARLALWAFPEPRTGGRLRLNSLCGVNLAAHALAKSGHEYGWVHCAPDAPEARARIERTWMMPRASRPRPSPTPAREGRSAESLSAAAEKALARLMGARVGLVGEPPQGFDTCDFDEDLLGRLLGVRLERISLDEVFRCAEAQADWSVAEARARVEAELDGTPDLDAASLERSLRAFGALSDLARERRLSALAVRCWPEFFTAYGCAACGPMAMSCQDGVPCACEADLHGALTSLLLQTITGTPPFMADLVDVDPEGDSAVLWHCGVAPLSMADPEERPRAAVHPNRRMPLLGDFALAPGRVTLARLSQSRGPLRLVIAGGEMLKAPRSFSGTSGVIRFDRPAGDVLETILEEGIEHHYSLAYGDCRAVLREIAERLSLPLLELDRASGISSFRPAG